ncbi:MAG: CheR family methyltransferase [Thermodesulfobacteriota bacterium]|nr:CheR family methyltransferase [Thermodesulfobacteriota bacterium]
MIKRKKKSTPDITAKKAADFHIVSMGASAGGLDAFERFFRNMPDNSGMGFVLVPHLDPSHTSMMPELIQKSSKMEVVQISEGIEVKPNTVYIVPPNSNLGILNGTLQLLEPSTTSRFRMPIDYFFRCLAEDQGDKAVCIILSGMGSDGTLGMRAIKGELGMSMAQTIDSAKYCSMPSSAIKTGLVDYILPPEKMPGQLIKYAQNRHPNRTTSKLPSDERTAHDSLQKILILLRTKTGHDFSGYKPNTILRRIERRMNIHQIEKIQTYVRFLQENTVEGESLFKELLIGVTSFFRDREAFKVLGEKALPPILEDKPRDSIIRAWVPGCSSGEEAYSIAILLRECMEKLNNHTRVQIFATDIDENAIDTARTGVYPASISIDIDEHRLRRFFISEDGNIYRIKKDIREMLIFAPQDIIKDPPFTKLDLICCRNLLIYFESEIQKKLLPLFHYSLNPGGILFLGSSETIGGFTHHFSPVDRKWKIYRHKNTISSTPIFIESPVKQPLERIQRTEEQTFTDFNIKRFAEKLLLQHCVPPSVIINEKGDILYIHGRTGKYFEPAPGEARLNIYEMAREGLKQELPLAIRKAGSQKTEVTRKGIQVDYNGGMQPVNITVRPMDKSDYFSGLFLIVFEDVSDGSHKVHSGKKSPSKKKADERIEVLKAELQQTRENLQTTIEEMETTNEELNSTNEELQSTNEELQSTNEELETSKEEQQSLNEELATVNAELQMKIEELTLSNNDMKNLLDSIDLPTVFLDNDLCIKRFTSHANKVINLIPSDIGRYISDITTKLRYDHLVQDAKAVLGDLVFREREVEGNDGTWYLLRILPYRTMENVIEGVVAIFHDITEHKKGKIARRLAVVVQDSNDAITIQDFDGNIKAWNRGAQEMYGYSEEEALSMNIREMIPEEEAEEALKMVAAIQKGNNVKSFKTRRRAKDGTILDVWVTVTKLVDDQGRPIELATTERDLQWLSQEA